MCFTPPLPVSSVGRMNIAPKNAGPRMTITQNHRWRTRSANSRRITARILRTRRLHVRARRGGGGLGADEIDKDLIERGLGELEARQPGPRGHQRPEDLLRVPLGRQL